MLSRREFIQYTIAGAAGTYLGFKPKIAESVTYNLEYEVERYINNLRKQGKISSNEKTAWSVYDFTSNKKLVSINEDTSLQAASLIKPFVALAFFHQVQFSNS